MLPYERTWELLNTLFGYQPGGGTLQSMPEQAYTALEPIEQAIKAAVRASSMAMAMKPVFRWMDKPNGGMF